MIKKTCDHCDKDITVGHYVLSREDTITYFGESNEARHFCNILCLRNWAIGQVES